MLWDRSQKEVKIIVNRDVTFNESDMPRHKGKIEPARETKLDEEKDQFKVKLGKLSTPTPTTPNEVEIQVQEPMVENSNEVVIEEHPKKENPLANYNLVRIERGDRRETLGGLEHWKALRWLLRYLKGTIDIGLKFSANKEGVKLNGFVDANYVGDRDGRKSTSSYVFTLSNSCPTLLPSAVFLCVDYLSDIPLPLWWSLRGKRSSNHMWNLCGVLGSFDFGIDLGFGN
ncbi:uncharacterized protein LOC111400428 [Olea europaea var. sylvestris]|uniref:uncharacterized protein LOC111400428 n=1 Tax=Olea europaea var. sylvestris TaxID=158386 RepID=UPI000C1CEB78|nr:uncharacterized protein LOC111400428 [Olea europaea var. sylvestris]